MYLTAQNIGVHILIAIPVFFISFWLAGKSTKNKLYKYITSGIITTLLTPVIYTGAVAVFFSILFHEPKKNFDKKVWLTNTSKRFQMADNIIDSKLLIKKDTNQIRLLLGTPAWRNDSLGVWCYDMGMGGGGLGFLFHYLNISLVNGKATRVDHAEVKD